MRVALLSYNAQAGDAIGNQVAEKLTFFLDRGADVRVLVESDRRLHPTIRPHCRIMARPEPRGEGWRFLASADLVVVEYGQYYRLLELLPLLAGGKRCVLFDYHGVSPPEWWPAPQREALAAGSRQRGLVWCADGALVHGRWTAQELREATAFPQERTHIVGNCLDGELFRPGPASRPLKEMLRLKDADLLLFVGRVALNKDVPVLVEAAARLKDRRPAVHAVIIGDAGDIYQGEARRCRELAEAHGIGDRLHLVGHVSPEQLRDAYRSASLLVLPSRHEGFGLPVVEAMASGLPVVAARATALPETIASAGLTFTPGDADDMARQAARVLDSYTKRGEEIRERPLRVAIVAGRYGTDFAGGAETSLRTIAETLHPDHHVEVFTTCNRHEHDWSNQLPEGSVRLAGIPVHRFALDPHDRARHSEVVRIVLQAEGPVGPEVEREYLEHSLHSSRLLEALKNRQDEFDAVIVGPYLLGLTLDVAQAWPDKTLLLPCFHNESVARLRAWQEVYGKVAGVLYHSPEEQTFAEAQLGINVPGAVCVDAFVDTETQGNPRQGAGLARGAGPYLLYCGRYSAQKGLPELLDRARRYLAQHSGRFTFVFVGQGKVAIPREPGFTDLDFVDEAAKRDLLAGAAALVLPSRFESLSYAALEAWAQGTPVIAERRCEVLAGHLERCGAGRAVGNIEEFAAALDDLAEHPGRWQALGRQGQAYIRERYGSQAAYRKKLIAAIKGLALPLAARMRAAGLRRAAEFERDRWRLRFGEVVDSLLDDGPRGLRRDLEIKLRTTTRKAAANAGTVRVPARVVNRGSHAALAAGPGRTVLRCRVYDREGRLQGETVTDLPGLLMPGRAVAAAVAVPVPTYPGTYQVGFWSESTPEEKSACREAAIPLGKECVMQLTVQTSGTADPEHCCTPLLNEARAALGEAHQARDLPTDYVDVTEGVFAAGKRWIKRKLLNNFKKAYVDVLSRQQTAFNQAVLIALEELAECCATLDHGVQEKRGEGRGARGKGETNELARRLADSEQRCAILEERLARLEAQLRIPEAPVY